MAELGLVCGNFDLDVHFSELVLSFLFFFLFNPFNFLLSLRLEDPVRRSPREMVQKSPGMEPASFSPVGRTPRIVPNTVMPHVVRTLAHHS